MFVSHILPSQRRCRYIPLHLSQAMSTSNITSSGSTPIVRSTAASGSQVYESRRAVDEYLLFHYGKDEDLLPLGLGPKDALNFTERSVNLCRDRVLLDRQAPSRALDLGCAVGSSSFELSKTYDEVIGIDFSQHFIDAANSMKSTGKMSFDMLVRGQVYKQCETKPISGDVDRTKVTFMQGDACNLSSQFDIVFASNLLCRLPSPKKFLQDVPSFIRPGGYLVLISPYSWLEEYTAVNEWIGGTTQRPESAAEVTSLLVDSASDRKLQLIHREDISFLIREHERKYQYGISDYSLWKKAS